MIVAIAFGSLMYFWSRDSKIGYGDEQFASGVVIACIVAGIWAGIAANF